MSEGDHPPPRKPPDRRKRSSVLDKPIMRRDLYNPEKSVVLAPGALRYCPALPPAAASAPAPAARKAAPPPPEDKGFRDGGTEFPPRAEPARPAGVRATKPRRRDSSGEESQGDEKRQRVLPLSPPLMPATPTSSLIPRRREASHYASALVRLPQPASPSPSPPRASPRSALALAGPSGLCVAQMSACSDSDRVSSSGDASGADDSSDQDVTSNAGSKSFAPSRDIPVPSPPSPTPSAAASYAAAMASPLRPRPCPPAPAVTTRPAPSAAPRNPLTPTSDTRRQPTPPLAQGSQQAGPALQVSKAYPPIVVECLPNWTAHFAKIRGKLGHAPNARPLGKGVRFIPRSPDEFRVVQRYLADAMVEDPTISWYSYSVAADLPTKIAIRGLPADTSPEEIKTALLSLDFPATYVRQIASRQGRAGCLFHGQLERLDRQELARLYSTTELLGMPGVTVEHWRGAADRVPQCHRCQAFGHSSANCHRPLRCVRCGGQHFAADCPRERTAKPTCANCAGEHTANDRRCPVFRREARKRGVRVPPPLPTARPEPATKQAARGRKASPPPDPGHRPQPSRRTTTAPATAASQGATLHTVANPPTERGVPTTASGKRRRRRGGRKRRKPVASSTPHPPPIPMENTSVATAPAALTRLAPNPPYHLPTPAIVEAGQSAPQMIPTALRAPATQRVPLPQRVRPGTRPRTPESIPAEDFPAPEAHVAPGPGTHMPGTVGDPLETIVRALTIFLIRTAAGGDPQQAAAHALHAIRGD